CLARRGERLHQESAGLGREPPADGHHTVFALKHMERSARVALGSLGGFGLAVHPAPAAHNAFTWSAVPARPTTSRRSSVSGVATRVNARTLAYESSPRASA